VDFEELVEDAVRFVINHEQFEAPFGFFVLEQPLNGKFALRCPRPSGWAAPLRQQF
jgi:hypothetical protein